MSKTVRAFFSIGEVAEQLGVAQHILRYWEQCFPQLRPLQRAGNRRYYRPEDVALARRIQHLLNVEGFTVRGAQQALSGTPLVQPATSNTGQHEGAIYVPAQDITALTARLEAIKARLGELL